MKISIVTISYNQAPYLEECIRSVLAQEGDIEYIVIDGGSDDGSKEIIEKYSDDIAYWISEHDDGPVDALNKGFAKATGELGYYLNSDDRLMPGALKTIQEEFDKNPDIDLIYGDCNKINATGEKIGTLISSKRFSPYRYLVEATMVCQPSTFFRLELFNTIGGFSVKNNTCWDGELLLQMQKCGANFRYFPKILSEFRMHSASITGSQILSTEYKQYRQYLFETHLNRPKGYYDKLCSYIFRCQDYPRRMIKRLCYNNFDRK